ncbi:hypothetical protein PPL_02620 [Heterostelium album PN500]|uniref:AB hydrolase-1 domain-containing protein n=1 Tax=Heterostelium pallidum (strain ATCC 26659 / Pp 5 / PN500) TaxID=670386 RepID=D3B2K6_HETP5|nr:hypothetical protein PPL_02620 [Heterostelium album PN500]EFA83554.1 hypothetical protein PPL_02620 [Heterostelium album PN500]|eukprot:XP_020435671.1 hypothetical protein PPL_02620 [Heterostelium album PN500]
MESKSIILSIALISCFFMIALADPTINYIGANDNGVSHFPVYQGLKMHIRCYANPNTSMSNGPVALFDAGLPFSSLVFANVLIELLPTISTMNISRACVFDRYGYGWSDPAPYPFMSTEFVYRLHGSLNAASIQSPYIMVGWSWGSVDIQNYALQYMNEVVGLLTIDGTDSAYAFDPKNAPGLAGATAAIEQLLQLLPTGAVEGMLANIPLEFGYIPSNPLGCAFPIEAQTANNQWWMTEKNLNTALQEVQIMIPSTSLLNQTYESMNTATPLSNIPLVVMTADSNGEYWILRQNVLASLSSKSYHIHDNTSSHFIPIQNPAGIVSALQTLLTYVDQHQPIIVI